MFLCLALTRAHGGKLKFFTILCCLAEHDWQVLNERAFNLGVLLFAETFLCIIYADYFYYFICLFLFIRIHFVISMILSYLERQLLVQSNIERGVQAEI